jgi:hypothetical protein
MTRAAQGIRPEKLAAEIQKQMKEYNKEVRETVWDIAMEVSGEAVQRLKAESPKREGTYAKSWVRSSTKKGIIVHSRAPEYRLTHLLEKGHALRRGGRKFGEAKAYPHIEKVEKECVEKYLSDVERRLGT